MEIDIFSSCYLSPLGAIEVKASSDGVISVLFVEKVSLEKPNEHTKSCIAQLEEYFTKTRKSFDVKLALEGTDFQLQVWSALAKISFGKTWSYKELAARIANPGSVRAVGAANGQNKILIVLPCHRVIGSNGELTGYAGELWRKKWLLEFEQDGLGKQMGLGF